MTSPNIPATPDHIIIHGLGVDGQAALSYFLSLGVTRISIIDTPDKLAGVYGDENIRPYTEESFPLPFLKTHDLYLRSPGIPPTNPLVSHATKSGIPITTPTGFWLAHEAPDSTITVTGTKGKSTTATLIADCLTWVGIPAQTYGNIGLPPLGSEQAADEVPVLEVSSYMMHDIPLKGHFHLVTNLYTEHTPWHGSKKAYQASKLRPFLEQESDAVLEHAGQRGLIAAECADYSPATPTVASVCPGDDKTIACGDTIITPAMLNPAFAAPSMVQALRCAMATILAAQLASPHKLADAIIHHLPDWQGLPSRQNQLITEDGVTWIDDSLATVPEATLSALSRWPEGRLHLLLGGADRGQQFAQLMDAIVHRGETMIYAFSDTAEKVSHAANALKVTVHQFDELEEVLAALSPEKDDIVLFSPAAPSSKKHGHYQVRSALFAERAGIPKD